MSAEISLLTLTDVVSELNRLVACSEKVCETKRLDNILTKGLVDIEKLRQYRPAPYREILIPKENGEEPRPIHKPSALDKLIERAILNVITPELIKRFSPHSYGGVPKKSIIDAVLFSDKMIQQGFTCFATLDIESCYENVLTYKIRDLLEETGLFAEELIAFIMRFPRAPFIPAGNRKPVKHRKGLHQGAPLSSILMNLYLSGLDRTCEMRKFNFYRNMDDVVLFFKTLKEAKYALYDLAYYIDEGLDLAVNKKKSNVFELQSMSFLGYQFNKNHLLVPEKENILRYAAKLQLMVQNWRKYKDIPEFIDELNQSLTGWGNFYQYAEPGAYLKKMDTWLRLKILKTMHQDCSGVKLRHRQLQQLIQDKRVAGMLALMSPDEIQALSSNKLLACFRKSRIVSLYEEVSYSSKRNSKVS